jgi:hypothetical protein
VRIGGGAERVRREPWGEGQEGRFRICHFSTTYIQVHVHIQRGSHTHSHRETETGTGKEKEKEKEKEETEAATWA